MVIFGALLTIFEASSMFVGSRGSCKNWVNWQIRYLKNLNLKYLIYFTIWKNLYLNYLIYFTIWKTRTQHFCQTCRCLISIKYVFFNSYKCSIFTMKINKRLKIKYGSIGSCWRLMCWFFLLSSLKLPDFRTEQSVTNFKNLQAFEHAKLE